MKKLLCVLLTLGVLLTLSALAETADLPAPQSVEQKLEAMIPVLDSLAISLNVESKDEAFRQEYDPSDSHLLWNQLWVLCADWLSGNASYRTEDGVAIPADVMDACARASFGTMEGDLPAIPKTSGESTVRYDAKADAYDVVPGDPDNHFMVIESYAADGDQMVVSCGVYDGETKERLGGMTARMNTAVEDEPLYPFEVVDAHAEARGDFDGLWANLCDIRYTEPAIEAEPEAQPTEAPAATAAPKAAKKKSSGGSSTKAKAPAYVKLSTGSKGAAVKTLQQRLKKLGYDCGTADGVYGASTKNAIRYFQDAIGAKQDGVASVKLQKKLFGKKAPKYVQYVKIKKGAKGIRVEKLQSSLRKLGYTAAPVDGSYGDRIVKAVKLFQTAAGLKADGIAGEQTLKAMQAKDAPECKDFIDLQKGDTGSRVAEMQRALVKLGYLAKVNEKYDDATVKAVDGFKQDYKVKGNGKSASADAVRMMVAAASSAVEPAETPTAEPTEKPTEAPTEAPKDDPTEAPKDDPTEAPKDDPTEAPKDDPTEAPKDDPTEAPKEDPTETPKEDTTEAPKEDPTEAPKEDPTEAPKEDPTEAPKEDPTEAPKEDPTEAPAEQPAGGESQSDKDAEEEAARKAEEEKRKAEEEKRKAEEEEAARKAEEEKRKAEEEKRKAEEEEAARKAEEEKRKAEEEKRKAEEEEAARKAEEKRKAEEEEAARKAEEKRKAEEEAAKAAAEQAASEQGDEG